MSNLKAGDTLKLKRDITLYRRDGHGHEHFKAGQVFSTSIADFDYEDGITRAVLYVGEGDYSMPRIFDSKTNEDWQYDDWTWYRFDLYFEVQES